MDFTQPDFLLLRTGYYWYSDFFRAVAYKYFQESGGTKSIFR